MVEETQGRVAVTVGKVSIQGDKVSRQWRDEGRMREDKSGK